LRGKTSVWGEKGERNKRGGEWMIGKQGGGRKFKGKKKILTYRKGGVKGAIFVTRRGGGC